MHIQRISRVKKKIITKKFHSEQRLSVRALLLLLVLMCSQLKISIIYSIVWISLLLTEQSCDGKSQTRITV